MRRCLSVLLALFALTVLAGCEGDFDQRRDDALTVSPGQQSTETTPNASAKRFVRGVASIGGTVRYASVVLRPVDNEGLVDWNDANVLGVGGTFINGIFQVNVQDRDYRGAILVEIRSMLAGPAPSDGGNPATAVSRKFHPMNPGHVLLGVVPFFHGESVFDVIVTPLTTVAVMRGLHFDGGIAGVTGGVSAGLFGMCCQQVSLFFGLDLIRTRHPRDFAQSGGFGTDTPQAYVLAALSQIAHDIGVFNVFDFWLGMALDAYDDGELNGSIGYVPNTPIPMPNLSTAGLIGTTLRDNYLDPNNLERLGGIPNTQITPGSELDDLITELDTARDINTVTLEYDFIFRVPEDVRLRAGDVWQTRVLAAQRVGDNVHFHPLGDSAGPGFVEFDWSSSAPAQVQVTPQGEIVVDALAPPGDYQVSLTIQPRAAQTFVTGPTEVFNFTVRVRP